MISKPRIAIRYVPDHYVLRHPPPPVDIVNPESPLIHKQEPNRQTTLILTYPNQLITSGPLSPKRKTESTPLFCSFTTKPLTPMPTHSTTPPNHTSRASQAKLRKRHSQPPAHPPPQPPPQTSTQDPNTLYTLISSAPLSRPHLAHILRAIDSATSLLQSHASLLPFAHENASDGPSAPFYATRTRSALLNLTATLTELLHDLVTQPWWPKRGQLFVQLRVQVDVLKDAERLSRYAGPERVMVEIADDARFFNVLVAPLLSDLKYAVERANVDRSVWSVLGEEEEGQGGRGPRGSGGERGGVDGKEKDRTIRKVESGLCAVRPGRKLSVDEGDALVMKAKEEKSQEEEIARCIECGCEVVVERPRSIAFMGGE